MRQTEAHTSDMVRRQDGLRARYREEPAEAQITDRGRTTEGDLSDPVHIWAIPGNEPYGVQWRLGVHRAVGGLHDAPNPGDLLCLALAVCMDSVIRMVADRHHVELEELEVDVTGDIDVRGTLWVSREARVGMQRMRCRVHLKPAEGTDPALLDRLLSAAERSCVNLDTLQHGVPVEIEREIG